MTSAAERAPAGTRRRVPVLVVAAALVALEAATVLAVGGSVVLGSDRGRLVMDVTTTAFFLFYGCGLLLCVRGLVLARRWARAPVVLAQLIQALVAWSFFSGETRLVAVLMVVTAVAVLVSVLSPVATRALVEGTQSRAPSESGGESGSESGSESGNRSGSRSGSGSAT